MHLRRSVSKSIHETDRNKRIYSKNFASFQCALTTDIWTEDRKEIVIWKFQQGF